jgi:hypothetical protein
MLEMQESQSSLSMRSSSMLGRRTKYERRLQKKKKSGQVQEISLYDVETSPEIEIKRQMYLDQIKDESLQSAQQLDEKI